MSISISLKVKLNFFYSFTNLHRNSPLDLRFILQFFILAHGIIRFYKQACAFIMGQRNKCLILTICIHMIYMSVKSPVCLLFFFGLVFLWRRSAMHILFLYEAQYLISPFFFRFLFSHNDSLNFTCMLICTQCFTILLDRYQVLV